MRRRLRRPTREWVPRTKAPREHSPARSRPRPPWGHRRDRTCTRRATAGEGEKNGRVRTARGVGGRHTHYWAPEEHFLGKGVGIVRATSQACREVRRGALASLGLPPHTAADLTTLLREPPVLCSTTPAAPTASRGIRPPPASGAPGASSANAPSAYNRGLGIVSQKAMLWIEPAALERSHPASRVQPPRVKHEPSPLLPTAPTSTKNEHNHTWQNDRKPWYLWNFCPMRVAAPPGYSRQTGRARAPAKGFGALRTATTKGRPATPRPPAGTPSPTATKHGERTGPALERPLSPEYNGIRDGNVTQEGRHDSPPLLQGQTRNFACLRARGTRRRSRKHGSAAHRSALSDD